VNNPAVYHRSAHWKISWLLVGIAVLCLPFADLTINTFDPMSELGRLFSGLLQPSIAAIEKPFEAFCKPSRLLCSVLVRVASVVSCWR